MHRKPLQLLLITCLAAAMGCQVSTPGHTGTPRAVVDYNTVQFRQNADLAIVLDLTALMGGRYGVLQAQALGSLSRIYAKVSGKNMAVEQTVMIDCSQVTNGQATLSFSHLPPGPVDVVINAVDAANQTIAYATGTAVIVPNTVARLAVKCQNATGGLVIDFDCPGLGGCGSPTTPPSATPVPTPTPSPLYPANPVRDGRLSRVFEIEADDNGGVFLLGRRPTVTAADYNRYSRVIHIKDDLSIDPTDVHNFGSGGPAIVGSLELIGDSLYTVEGQWGVKSMIHRTPINAPYTDTSVQRPWSVHLKLGRTVDGQLLYSTHEAISGTTKFAFYVGDPASAVRTHATTFGSGYYLTGVAADENNVPLWTAQGNDAGGLFTLDAADNTITLVNGTLSAADRFTSIEALPGPSHTYFITGKDGKLRYYDPAAGVPVEVAFSAPEAGYIQYIDSDDDGNFYLLFLTEAPANKVTDYEKFYVKKYRLEWNAQGQPTFVRLLTLVDAVNASPAPNP